MTTSLAHIQSGKLRAIAIAGAERTPKLAERADHGGGGLSQAAIAVLARRGGAGRNAARHHRQTQHRVSRKLWPAETRDRLAKLGAEAKIGTPEEFGNMIANELALWQGVVRDANITVE